MAPAVSARVCKASAKLTDPNNAASASSKKKQIASVKNKTKAKASLSKNAPNLPAPKPIQFTAGGWDPALQAGLAQTSGTSLSAQMKAASASTSSKRKVTTELRSTPLKKAKKLVVESDDGDIEIDGDDDDNALDEILGDVEVVDNDEDEDDDDKDGDGDDQEDKLERQGQSDQEDENKDEETEGCAKEDDQIDANVQDGSLEELEENENENPPASGDDFSKVWDMMEDDIRADNGIEEVDALQHASPTWVPPSTPSRASSSNTPTLLPTRAPVRLNTNGKVSYKININHFTPRTQRVLSVTRPEFRRAAALEHAFPDMDRHALVRQAAVIDVSFPQVKGTRLKYHSKAADSAIARYIDGKEAMEQTLNRAFVNPAILEPFITYVTYARSGLLSTIMAKTRNSIAGHYSIPGGYDNKTIGCKVEWLLQQGTFKMGTLDVANETCDRQQPYQNDIYATLIRTIFFSKGRADAAVFKQLTINQAIPGPLFALLSTAIEHALTLWSGGAERRGDFGEGNKDRYEFHLQSWRYLEEQAPTYATKLSKKLFRTVAEQTNKTFLLEEAKGELEGIDMANLEAMAKVDDVEPNAAPSVTPAEGAAGPVPPQSTEPAPAAASSAPAPASSTSTPTVGCPPTTAPVTVPVVAPAPAAA
ncbi:hypothetical protein V5O48_013948 [Marasmius crinis-equi]|uniref:DUF6532 domain-containing protein n=1 Tax=Marasmius crinis-equi TaxID=585013 RepID=A0ABR3EYT6_9AGAR